MSYARFAQTAEGRALLQEAVEATSSAIAEIKSAQQAQAGVPDGTPFIVIADCSYGSPSIVSRYLRLNGSTMEWVGEGLVPFTLDGISLFSQSDAERLARYYGSKLSYFPDAVGFRTIHRAEWLAAQLSQRETILAELQAALAA